MTNAAENSGCKMKCWLLAALLGLLVLWLLSSKVAFWMALLAGVCMFLFLVIMLSRLCGIESDTAPATAPQRAAAAAVAAPVTPQPAAKPAEPAPVTEEKAGEDYDGDGVVEGENEGQQPAALSGPRDGQADDLKQIKGVGPKLEKMLNEMGFYHFDQIAGWTADEVAWVDANLKGFKGRVSRDGWQQQAKILATGGETEFSKRVEDGDVY